MSLNGLYALAGALVVVVVALAGYIAYERSQQPQLEIRVDKGGIEVNGNG
jgi:hypothetical protein